MIRSLTLAGELDLLLPITALLPLTAILLVAQSNPYQTLVMRGILGSVATLVYALLGAPDVALTEAMVGTLLSTTLYAVALRSSMVLRLTPPLRGSLAPERETALRAWLEQVHLRLEWTPADGHGRIGADGELVLSNRRLAERLRAAEGYGQWQAAGGRLLLETPR
jgi:putative multicomponent Na+:H+ antiporter subunit B